MAERKKPQSSRVEGILPKTPSGKMANRSGKKKDPMAKTPGGKSGAKALVKQIQGKRLTSTGKRRKKKD